ncbi:MAG: hypothetical protein WCK39_07945 [Methanomassiliicoccales archaeon]
MNRFAKVKACLRTLGYSSLSSDNFEDKLLIQKIVYLLSLQGLELGYPYGLYFRGPYSPALTRDIYDHGQELRYLESEYALSVPEVQKIEEFMDIMELRPAQLEVAATYAYFAYERGEAASAATASVRRMKGFYPEAQIALGISKAKQLLYRPTAEEARRLKKETELWENASEADLDDGADG